MKKTILIGIMLVLTFIFASTAVAVFVGPSINSVSLSETDNFYSPCSGNDVVNIVADVSGAVAVMANFSAFAGMDCGNGSDTINLVNTAGTTWQGSCDVSSEAAASDFVGGPVVIVALDALPPTVPPATDSNQNIILYNMATPPEREGTCDKFGSSTTNMCGVDDFTDVNFVIEIQTNGTCQGEQMGQEMPWSDFKTVVLFNFSSIDMTSDGIGEKLAALGSALSVYITPPGMFGDSYIGVDTSAFAELNTQSTISLYGLPFAVEPTITGDDPGAITVDSYVLNTPYTIEITCEDIAEDVCEEEACTAYCSDPDSPACTGCIDSCLDESGDEIIAECQAEGEDFTMTVPNADLTFTVTHFSQYNVTDDEAPTVSINSPSSEATVNREYSVSVSANGTGSQISSIKLYINGELDQELESTDIFNECSNDDNDWTVVTCSLDVAADSQNDANITVVVTDFGGAAGLSASANVDPVHVEFCGSTIEQNITLAVDMDCSGSSTDGLNPLQDVTIDCNGYSIIGGGAYKGINNRGYNGVTVKNCNIYGFETGIYAVNSNGLTITNNNVSQNYASTRSGICLESVYGSTVSNNYVFDNDVGIHLVGSYENTISSNTIEDNNQANGGYYGYGILLEDSCGGDCEDNYGNVLTGNTISGHNEAGIYSYYGSDNNITGGEIYSNDEGIRLESSTANIKNVNLHDNFIEPPLATGLYVDGSSIAYVENGEFLNNGDYAITDGGPESVYWTITGAAKCINNSVYIGDGSITFDGGTLELENCLLSLPDDGGRVEIDKTGTISSLDFDVQSVTTNTSTDFNFSESAVSLTLSSDVTTTLSVTGETPGSAPSGFTALKGIDIEVDSTTEGALISALIKIYYSDAELTAANIAESSLKIYYYNETAGAWQLEPDQGVDTANNYVWARVTHFSIYGAFGTAPSNPSYVGGGGGGGSSFYKKNTTSPMTSATTVSSVACSDDWICDEWGPCNAGVQTRYCGFNDYPECTRADPKPETQQACSAAKEETAPWTSPGPQPEQSPVSEVINQGITGAATVAEKGISALTKQVGIGIAILVVIGGLAGYLLLFRR